MEIDWQTALVSLTLFPHTPHIETVVVLELKQRVRTVARTERSTAHLSGRHERPATAEEFKPKEVKKKKPPPPKPWSRMPKRPPRS